MSSFAGPRIRSRTAGNVSLVHHENEAGALSEQDVILDREQLPVVFAVLKPEGRSSFIGPFGEGAVSLYALPLLRC